MFVFVFPFNLSVYYLRSCSFILLSVTWTALYNSLRYNRDVTWRDDALILNMTFFQVIEHQPYDSCCDWWSLGVMLYYMLTSKVCDRSCEFIVTLVSAVDTLVIISSFRNSMEDLHWTLNWLHAKTSENVNPRTFPCFVFFFLSFHIRSRIFNSFTSISLRVMNKPHHRLGLGHWCDVSNHELQAVDKTRNMEHSGTSRNIPAETWNNYHNYDKNM